MTTADQTAPTPTAQRWRDLVLDVTVPLFFAIMTAGFFALAAQ
jgi:hypothetical protein